MWFKISTPHLPFTMENLLCPFVYAFSSLPWRTRCIPPMFLVAQKEKKREGGIQELDASYLNHLVTRYLNHLVSPLLLPSWKVFKIFSYWFLGIKKRLYYWLYSKKIEKKSSSQREKDKEEDGSSFLCAALKKKEFSFQIFFLIFFNIKIRLDLIFNMNI